MFFFFNYLPLVCRGERFKPTQAKTQANQINEFFCLILANVTTFSVRRKPT